MNDFFRNFCQFLDKILGISHVNVTKFAKFLEKKIARLSISKNWKKKNLDSYVCTIHFSFGKFSQLFDFKK